MKYDLGLTKKILAWVKRCVKGNILWENSGNRCKQAFIEFRVQPTSQLLLLYFCLSYEVNR
jgi:hypothetical protein